jgi:hypothetical protein
MGMGSYFLLSGFWLLNSVFSCSPLTPDFSRERDIPYFFHFFLVIQPSRGRFKANDPQSLTVTPTSPTMRVEEKDKS